MRSANKPLDQRKRRILGAVIHEYIGSAQPVASETLVRRWGLKVSSATVRNELAELEERGLLTHPHTSAGRMPTARGYRFFIESLMEEPDLEPDERMMVRHQFHQFQQALLDASEWSRLAASVLARLCASASLVTAPQPEEARPRTPASVPLPEVYHDGVLYLLEQPEFSSVAALRELLALLEDRFRLREVLPALEQGEVRVVIGEENQLEPLRPFSLVFGRYGAGGRLAGYMGVVGPTRMDYARSIGAVRYVGALMSELLRAEGGWETAYER